MDYIHEEVLISHGSWYICKTSIPFSFIIKKHRKFYIGSLLLCMNNSKKLLLGAANPTRTKRKNNVSGHLNLNTMIRHAARHGFYSLVMNQNLNGFKIDIYHSNQINASIWGKWNALRLWDVFKYSVVFNVTPLIPFNSRAYRKCGETFPHQWAGYKFNLIDKRY